MEVPNSTLNMKSTIKFLLFKVIVLVFTLNVFSQVPNYVPTNGLVGYWPFNGNANDESGNGNNGTVNGATLTTDRFGNANSAYSFDGVNDWIEVSNSPGLTLTGDVTLSAWVKTNGSNGQNYQTIISKRETYWTWEYMMSLSYHSGIIHENKMLTSRALGAGNQEQAWTELNYLPAVWEFWTVAYSQGQVRLYKNGVLDHVETFSMIPNPQNCPLLFGRNTLADNSEQFFGSIDDISIYNRVLTPQEITNLYTSTVPPTAAVLSGDATICLGSSTNLSVAVTGGTAPYTVIVTDGSNNYSATGASPVSIPVSPTATSTYTIVSLTGGGTGTGNTGTAIVTVIDATITASDTEICAGDSVTLSVPQGGSSNTACAALPTNLQTGLVGNWPFCGNANDESGNGNNGTVNGASLTSDRNGNPNSAYSFNGSSDYISLPNFFLGGSTSVSDLTYFLEFKIDQLPPSGTTYTISGQQSNWRHKMINIESDGTIQFHGTSSSAYFDGISPLSSIVPNQWYCVAITFSSSTIKLYLDGLLVSTSTTSFTNMDYSWVSGGNQPPFLTNYFGGFHVSAGITNYFQGTIDEFATWNRELTASEIQQLNTLGQSTYLWSNGSTTATINVSPTSTTTYTCTVTTNGVSCTDSVTVVVNTPTIDLENDITACGTSTTLTAPSGYDSYLWSNGAITNTTTVSANGTYSCTVTQGGCSASDSIDVTLIDATISASDSVICAGDSVTLSIPTSTTSSRTLVAQYTLTFDGPFNYVLPTEIGEVYEIEMSGVYAVFCDSWGQMDAAFAFNQGPAEANPSFMFWNGSTIRPTPNVYNPTHNYIYTNLVATNDTQNFGFTDNPYYDNCGSLTMNIYKISSVLLVSHLWSTGATTPTINVSPTITTTYTCTTTINGVSCSSDYTITVNNSTSSTDVQTACDSYTWIDGVIYTSSNNTATFTTTNTAGCDSLITLNLTITPSSINTTPISACDSYSWNGTTYTATGVYTGTTANCVTQSLNLTITPSSTNTTPISACDSYTWNGTTYTASGVYTGTTANCVTESLNLTITPSSTNTTTAAACDSYTWNGTTYTASGVYTGTTANCVTQSLNLTITPSSTNTTTAAACNSYTWNGTSYTASGVYTGTTTNCVTQSLNLTITPSSTYTISVSACGTYTWPNNGQTYTTSGVYTGTTANCVTQSLNLTITPNTSVTTTINANDTYTWAANGITYTASGIYTGPTSANCVTQYLNLTINSSGISEEELVLFSLYPNPVSDMLYVNLNGQDKQDYLIIDNFGAVIKRGVLGNLINEISVSQLSAGLYYFKIEGTKPRKFSKID